MNPIYTLSMRASAASLRLSELEQKSQRSGDSARVTAAAVRELQSTIADLHAAIVQLNDLSDRITAAKADGQASQAQYDELRESMPTACVFTDESGTVLTGNASAGELLNISARHLRGKPLLLFVSDRNTFARLLNTTRVEGIPAVGELTIRPRDRKPRRMSAQVQLLPAHQSRCWFFTDPRATTPLVEAPEESVPPAE